MTESLSHHEMHSTKPELNAEFIKANKEVLVPDKYTQDMLAIPPPEDDNYHDRAQIFKDTYPKWLKMAPGDCIISHPTEVPEKPPSKLDSTVLFKDTSGNLAKLSITAEMRTDIKLEEIPRQLKQLGFRLLEDQSKEIGDELHTLIHVHSTIQARAEKTENEATEEPPNPEFNF